MATLVWIAGIGGAPPPASFAGPPVWVAGYGPTAIGSATEVKIVGWGYSTPPSGVAAVWVTSFGKALASGGTPIWIT